MRWPARDPVEKSEQPRSFGNAFLSFSKLNDIFKDEETVLF